MFSCIPRPGTDLIWLSAVTKYIFDNGLADQEFIDQVGERRGRNSKEPGAIHARDGERALRPPDRNADQGCAHDRRSGSVCILWAMGVTQHVMGSDTSTAISNLLLATGNYMRPGTGAYPLRGHNNVQGASDHGAMPNFFPGYQKVDDPAIRAKFEKRMERCACRRNPASTTT